VRSRYIKQLIPLNMKKNWPTLTGMEDSQPLLFCKQFSYEENALYRVSESFAIRGPPCTCPIA